MAEGIRFLWEPTSESSKKNPELLIKLDGMNIGIEVKSPSILKHERLRSVSNYQLTERGPFTREWADKNNKNVVLPRDNVIKDFLYSANEKFEGFKKYDNNFYGIIVIVWDDYIYEPLTSLISQSSGLFTDASFAKDKNNNILRFNNVDGVVLVRHIHQFQNAAAERTLIDNCKHALDYGKPNQFPFKAYLPNPYGKEVPNLILECLQASTPDITWGAEYMPSNGVMWFGL